MYHVSAKEAYIYTSYTSYVSCESYESHVWYHGDTGLVWLDLLYASCADILGPCAEILGPCAEIVRHTREIEGDVAAILERASRAGDTPRSPGRFKVSVAVGRGVVVGVLQPCCGMLQ